VRDELAFAIRVEGSHARSLQGSAIGVDGGADCGVKFVHDGEQLGAGFGLVFEEGDKDESCEFVNGDEEIAEALGGDDHFLEVNVENAGLGGWRRKGAAVCGLGDASLGAAGAVDGGKLGTVVETAAEAVREERVDF
jgi:hypothetical protein